MHYCSFSLQIQKITVQSWLLFEHELYAKKKRANTLVTEWDPCHDSVLAIGEQVGHSSQLFYFIGVKRDHNKNYSFILTQFLVKKEKKRFQLLVALVHCCGFVHILNIEQV